MAQPVKPDLIYHLTTVSNPDLSPDGSRLAFVKAWIDRDSMEDRSQIQMLELSLGEPEPFTQGARDNNPRFSPDGLKLAFLRSDAKGRSQVWIVGVNGGEARQLTHLPGGVTEFDWAPDSQRIAVVSDVDPDRPPDDHDAKKDPRAKVVTRLRYREDTARQVGSLGSGWRGDAHLHIFVVDVRDGSTRQLTDGDWDDTAPSWSPDGQKIAFVSGRRDDRDFWAFTEVYVVPSNGGEAELRSEGLYTVVALSWSPDGTKLVVVGSDVRNGGAFYQGWLYVVQPGARPLRLTDDSIRPVAGSPPQLPLAKLRWTKENRVLFLADAKGETFLCSVPAAGGEVQRIAGGGAQMVALALDAGTRHAVVVLVPPDSPGDLHLIDLADSAKQQLTSYNQLYFQEHPPAKLQKFSVKRGSWQIESRAWLPPDFSESKRYPMVLEIHGGPQHAWYDAFNPVAQILATAGYIVLAVNPRGSTTYGEAFAMAVLRDWGGQDYLDHMAAVDEMTSRPYVDASRLGVHGYSYGGYMTSWIIGHETRFRAAVVGGACTDLSSMYGTSDIGISGERHWGGRRDELLDEYLKRSSITYAANVTAPVLLLHGETDLSATIGQAEQYFVELKRLGKDVEFVRFPDSNHYFRYSGHPKFREEYLSRVLEWFDRHL